MHCGATELVVIICWFHLTTGQNVYLEFLEKTSDHRVVRPCDDCNSDAIDLSENPVPFGEYYHHVAHVSG